MKNEFEIEDTLRRRYLDRLALRVRKMRKQLMERSWEELRNECHQIRVASESFGFPTLKSLALLAEESIPPGKVSRASALPHARQAVEAVVMAIDHVLLEHAVLRT